MPSPIKWRQPQGGKNGSSYGIINHKPTKSLDRLTYIPKKHKQKVRAALRQKLQQKTIKPVKPVPLPSVIKFGSFNVNGLDLEAAWIFRFFPCAREAFLRTEQLLLIKLNYRTLIYPPTQTCALCILMVSMGGWANKDERKSKYFWFSFILVC